jgi:bifunctional non-homologous end joining protein LigD
MTSRTSAAANALSAPTGPLAKYWAKRDFNITAEPRGEQAPTGERLTFVIQKHAASSLHYDFRLELDGVLLSWAVPKGPSLDPADKRLAVRTEDHPMSYASFEGVIPPKQYGAGTVIVWDNGSWKPVGDARRGLAEGKLMFELHGQKLEGLWELVNITKAGAKQEQWLLFKKRGDEYVRPRSEFDVVSALPDSVIAKPLKTRAKQPAPAPAPEAKTKAPAKKAAKSSSRTSTHSAVPGAVKAPMPAKLQPQLATLSTGVPATGEWTYEIKFDGYRLMAKFEGGEVALVTRGGHDWADKMPGLVAELKQLGLKSSWLDGEIVVLDEKGAPNFNRLQKSFDRKPSSAGIDYFLFDVPYFEGYDLREVALVERRRLLKALLDEKGAEHVRYSADFPGDPASVLQSACRMNLEGVIAKRTDAPYASRRTETWLKLKCKLRQEFVVCGYTDRSDGAPQVGSLLLGVYDDAGELTSVGSVGTGWNSAEAAELKTKLQKLETDATPFAAGPGKPGRWSKRRPGTERWVEPKIVAEVEYAEITPDGQIRHGAYISLRTDKPPKSIRRETAKTPESATPIRPAGKAAAGGIKVSHGDRVIDPSTGLTKLDLVRYYESVAEFMLPHLKGRPCALVRGPTGIKGELFFQKHSERTSMPGVVEMDPELWPKHAPLLEVATAQGLAGAAQMNVIEFHTWNSTKTNIESPDRMIFDLDPGQGTRWPHIQEAALLVRGFLKELGLESWLKTSGGKGLHVVVPLATKHDYDQVNKFSKAVVEHLARVIPSRFVAKSGPSNRVGKLFVDYLRNGRGATTAAAFSARARPGLGVSMPVSWDDLAELKSGDQWTVATAREHLSFQSADPWASYWKNRQTLTKASKAIGLKTKD